jgi:hypothetical protein
MRPSESLKKVAAELSRLIGAGSGDAATINSLFKQLPLAEREPSPLPASTQVDAVGGDENMIGIWRKIASNDGVVYERDTASKRYWHQWANVHKLYPKKNKKRVVLLGESVARAFLYDPFYTVATELEGTLNHIPGMPAIEVTDLARTNCRMNDLLTLVQSCKALDPDGVVIFAGNNWHADLYGSLKKDHYQEMYGILKEQGLAGLKAFVELRFSTMVELFLQKVQEYLCVHNIPVVFIIPAYNLGDWKTAYHQKSTPWLSEKKAQAWFENKNVAEQALLHNDWAQLGTAAEQMVALDPFHPYSYQLSARYFMSCGKRDEAIRCLEAARDASLIYRGNDSNPVCFGIVRKTIRMFASQYGVVTVDSPAIFDQLSEDEIPGREFFLDYCHLTIEAIKITMQHTASALGPLIASLHIPVEEIKDSGIDPAAELRAVAHFSAAIHNAHRDQPADIIGYHCNKALSCFDGVKKVMLQFVDFATRHTPTTLCKAFEDVIATGKMRQYDGGFSLQHPKGHKLMDIKLVNEIALALRATGIDINDDVALLRMQEHAVNNDKINLLDPFYSSASYNDVSADNFNATFLQVRATESSFAFIADKRSELSFELIYRTLNACSTDKKIGIIINGEHIKMPELPASDTWRAITFTVDRDLLVNGVNQLTITWPYAEANWSDMNNSIGRYGFFNALSPVLGEIHSFSTVVKSEMLIAENNYSKSY